MKARDALEFYAFLELSLTYIIHPTLEDFYV